LSVTTRRIQASLNVRSVRFGKKS